MDITEEFKSVVASTEEGKERFWFKKTGTLVWALYPLDVIMMILTFLLIGLLFAPAYWRWRNRIFVYSSIKQVDEHGTWGINLWSTRRRYSIAGLIFLGSLLIIGLITIIPFKMACQSKDLQYEYMKREGLLDKDFE